MFDVMGGLQRETTSADDAYAVLVFLTVLSIYVFPVLAVIYGFLVSFRLLEWWKEKKATRTDDT